MKAGNTKYIIKPIYELPWSNRTEITKKKTIKNKAIDAMLAPKIEVQL